MYVLGSLPYKLAFCVIMLYDRTIFRNSFLPVLAPSLPLSQKYTDIFAGVVGFWLFGYAISGNSEMAITGEEQDYIFWFFRVR